MHYTALPTDIVRALQSGGMDANGQPVERKVSDGQNNPCRHCLRDIPKGAEMLVLAYRPFENLHAYAETGPLFLCADHCDQGCATALPEILTTSPDYLLKGYSADERIVYGTGAIVTRDKITEHAKNTFKDPTVDFIHVRSARNNCYQLRIDRD